MLPASTYRPTSLRLEIDSSDADKDERRIAVDLCVFSISGAYAAGP